MPLQSFRISDSVQARIQKKIRSLVKSGIFPGADRPHTDYNIAFVMAVQLVPKKQSWRLSFGKPEGIRVFVEGQGEIIAAADFLFSGRRISFSHIYQGSALATLVATLNRLEKKYARTRTASHAELVSFLFAPGLFILVKSNRQRQFYHGMPKKLRPISADGLKQKIKTIWHERPAFDH